MLFLPCRGSGSPTWAPTHTRSRCQQLTDTVPSAAALALLSTRSQRCPSSSHSGAAQHRHRGSGQKPRGQLSTAPQVLLHRASHAMVSTCGPLRLFCAAAVLLWFSAAPHCPQPTSVAPHPTPHLIALHAGKAPRRKEAPPLYASAPQHQPQPSQRQANEAYCHHTDLRGRTQRAVVCICFSTGRNPQPGKALLLLLQRHGRALLLLLLLDTRHSHPIGSEAGQGIAHTPSPVTRTS